MKTTTDEVPKGIRLSEDWTAVLLGAVLLVLIAGGWLVFQPPGFKWTMAGGPGVMFKPGVLQAMGYAGGVVVLAAVAGVFLSGGRVRGGMTSQIAVVVVLAYLAQMLAGEASVKGLGLEYVLFALVLGMIGGALGLGKVLAGAIRTELYIKTGLVLFGATIVFPELLKAGALGLVQALGVVAVVWYVALWLSRRLKVDDESAAMLASAVSICGVSAAIAACGVIQGDRRKLSLITSLVMLVAMPMMVVMPWIAKWTGMPELVAGAWFGGTLDTSGSVAAAGAQVSKAAEKIGIIVKFSQNVLIGVAALFISVWWASRGKGEGRKVTAMVIWERFPKFVLGFMGASLLFSFAPEWLGGEAMRAEPLRKTIESWRTLWFAMAFVSIGLETRPAEIFGKGNGGTAAAFIGAQAFNVVWTLVLAWVLFSGRFFALPVLK